MYLIKKHIKTTAYCFLCLLGIFTVGCRNDTTGDDAELTKISRERDSLIELSAKKDSAINAFVSSFADIESNLLTIKQKEDILLVHAKKNIGLSGSRKNEMNENIKIINDLTEKNRQKIILLNAKLKDASFAIGQLGDLVQILLAQINTKNQDLIVLNEILMPHGAEAMQLNTNMIGATDSSNQKTTSSNTAYYIIGQTGELVEKKIIDEKGGFFSPNQYAKINPDFDKSYFTKINIKQTTTIRIGGKHAKLITTHPTNSYTLETTYNNPITNLVITNPGKFWRESKFLVVSVD